MSTRPTTKPLNIAGKLYSLSGIDPHNLMGEPGGMSTSPQIAEWSAAVGEGRLIEDPRKADREIRPLPGGKLNWREWLADVAPEIRADLMSREHIKLWRWEESLRLGVRPDAFGAIWPRAYGKTTTARLILSRVCARGARRFGLYVCGTLASANASLVSVRSELERQGVRRRESVYGHSLGWSGERIVTDNGFTLLALGLDVANIRGLNLDKLRPDLIILDDIDGLTDSPEVSDKKLEILASTIIPAGSRDCAYLITQNEIHGHSVVHRWVSGEAGFLRRRIVSKCVAVDGLRVASAPRGTQAIDTDTGEIIEVDQEKISSGGWSMADAPGEWPELEDIDTDAGYREDQPGVVYEDELRIVGGTSTWPGKSIAEWEAELNSTTEQAFRREMQHELGAGGLFFAFHKTRQILTPEGDLSPSLPWHECDMPRIEPWWIVEAGGDYGTASPHADVIGVRDDYGVLYVVGEEGAANRTATQQAQALLLRLEELGLASGIRGVIAERDPSVPGGIRALDLAGKERPAAHRLSAFALDPADTFPPEGKSAQTAQQRMSEYPVDVYYRYGIPAVRAQKSVVTGLSAVLEAMNRTLTYPASHPTEPGQTVPMLRVVRGMAPNFQRYLETAVKDPKDEMRAVAAGKLEHYGDGGRYLTMRVRESSDPARAFPLALRDGTIIENPERFSEAGQKALRRHADPDRSKQLAAVMGVPAIKKPSYRRSA